jgi:uncharacterized phiE125 gp8 family phage protein
MALKLITPPAIEPIALSEMMNFSRIDSDADTITMEAMITAARQEAEKITSRQLITATWELRLDCFPVCTIYMPYPPVQSVNTLKYLDESGTEQTLVENIDYLVDIYSEPARITPAYGEVWPITQSVMNAVRIVFTCGYGDADTDIPQSIRNWIMVMAGTLYENRELELVTNTSNALTHLKFIDGLLDEYRCHSF